MGTANIPNKESIVLRLWVMILALIVLGSCQMPLVDRISVPSRYFIFNAEIINEDDFEAELLDIVNAKRQELGLSTLITDTTLMQVAEAHSVDMATHYYLSHEDLKGGHAGERITKGGYKWKYWGEVLAGGAMSPREAFDGWMNSPLHKAVILDEAYQEVGIGFATSEENLAHTYYWTVVLAIPKGER